MSDGHEYLSKTDFLAKNYVGRKIIFELKFEDCMTIVAKYALFLGKVYYPGIGIYF